VAIVLPADHPHAALATPGDAGAPRVRIGIVNIMPRLEAYEGYLLAPLAEVAARVEPVFLQLGSHGYQSSDRDHLARFYRPVADALAGGPLDGLIVTGAPVEELAFEDVHYYRELVELLGHARGHVGCTLGLCWGGMLLGHLVGVGKRAHARKLFGVFEDQVLVADHDLVTGAAFPCAHSRHAWFVEADLARAAAAGEVTPLGRGERTGTSMFETRDRRFVAHLGHPEYDGARLAFEWERDRGLGRTDVSPPENFDTGAPATPWRAHRARLFAGFVARAAGATPAR
jgi:homoserine O-succinyltransferase/O-acetyltransferase